MKQVDDKRYCVIDHANKQKDRERGYPKGPARPRKPYPAACYGVQDGQSGDSDASEPPRPRASSSSHADQA